MTFGSVPDTCSLNGLSNTLCVLLQLHLIHWNSTLFNTLEDALGKRNGVLIIALFVQVTTAGIRHSIESPCWCHWKSKFSFQSERKEIDVVSEVEQPYWWNLHFLFFQLVPDPHQCLYKAGTSKVLWLLSYTFNTFNSFALQIWKYWKLFDGFQKIKPSLVPFTSGFFLMSCLKKSLRNGKSFSLTCEAFSRRLIKLVLCCTLFLCDLRS